MSRSGRLAADSFPTTEWHVVRNAGAESPAGDRPALGELLSRYWPALRAHLVHRKRVREDRAEELIQSFIEKKILQRNLVQAADPARGKFRTFLLTALDRFLIDRYRRATALDAASSLDDETAVDPADDEFGLGWAMQVVVETIRRTRAECEAKVRPDLWGVFAGRVLTPLAGGDAVSYQLLAQRFGLTSEKQAANRYITVEAMFQRNFREELSTYARDAVEEEAADFRRILSQAGADLVERLRIELWKDIPEVTISLSPDSGMNRSVLIRLLELPPAAEDRAAMLQTLLAAPIPANADDRAEPASLGELLRTSGPPLSLLKAAKDFAKEIRTSPESPILPAAATVLYYACIASALVHHDMRISRHDDITLVEGFRWCVQSWVEMELQTLFREGEKRLKPGGG